MWHFLMSQWIPKLGCKYQQHNCQIFFLYHSATFVCWNYMYFSNLSYHEVLKSPSDIPLFVINSLSMSWHECTCTVCFWRKLRNIFAPSAERERLWVPWIKAIIPSGTIWEAAGISSCLRILFGNCILLDFKVQCSHIHNDMVNILQKYSQ